MYVNYSKDLRLILGHPVVILIGLKDGGADRTDEFFVHIPHKPADVVTHIYYLKSMYLVYWER